MAQVWATLLDEGVYLAASTMYRLLRGQGSPRTPPPGDAPDPHAPELVADGPDVWSWDIERHEAPDTEWRCKTATAALSQQDGEAGGSLIRETPGRVASSPDNDGTCQHYRMVRARQARREGGREEPAF